MNINLARLNTLVTIWYQVSTQDELGQPVAGVLQLAQVWADVRHNSGAERIKADADTSVVKASIRIRYRTDVTAGMHVYVGATKYNILAVMPDIGGKEYTDLVCEVIQ